MATVPTHAVAAIALAPLFLQPADSPGWWVAGAVAAMVPDLDVLAFRLGVPYGSPFGHRGFTHSLLFATGFAALLCVLASQFTEVPLRIGFYLLAAIASHGILDALTNGGHGIGFLLPFTPRRFFFAWRPIQVCPIGVAWFFTRRAWRVLRSELIWVWLPAAMVFLAGWLLRPLR